MNKARWTPGQPQVAVDQEGALTASVPLRDNNVIVATIRFTITSDRALRINVENKPGSAGLTGFEAWSDL
jgi:hypothetical protein